MTVQRDPSSGIFICGEADLSFKTVTNTRPNADRGPNTGYPIAGWKQCEYWVSFGQSSRRCTTRFSDGSSRVYCYEHEKVANKPVLHRCLYYTCGEYIDTKLTYCPQHSGNPGILDLARKSVTVPDATGDSTAEVTDEGTIDHAYAAKVRRSTSLKYRRHRKSSEMETVHYKLEIKGKRDDIAMFHAILGELDHDYPFKLDRPGTTVPGCDKCHGYVWERASLEPDDVKRAAKQIGIYVKFKHYCTQAHCGGEVKQVAVGAQG